MHQEIPQGKNGDNMKFQLNAIDAMLSMQLLKSINV